MQFRLISYVEYFPFFKSWTSQPSQFCARCNSHKSCKLAQGKFVVGQGLNRENTGNLKMQFDRVPGIKKHRECAGVNLRSVLDTII